MHVISISISILSLAVSVSILATTIPMNFSSLLLISSQVGVYVVIGLFGWLCRKNRIASGIVTLMAFAAIGLGALMLYFVVMLASTPAAGPVLILIALPVFGQMIVGCFGCYIGYAVVEYHALSVYQGSSVYGKLITIFLIVAAVFAASFWAFAV